MIYGLYLSATGIMTSAYRQDVVANNLANSDTTGFKRDIASFRQRLTEQQESRRLGGLTNPILEGLGGGTLVMPNHIDLEQGALEETGAPLDVAIEGNGFFAVDEGGQTRLTRDGRFQVNRDGSLVLPDGQKVLDDKFRPITLAPDAPTTIDQSGEITQNGQVAGRIGLFDVPDRAALTKVGGNLLSYPDRGQIRAASGSLHNGFLERSNADPTTELTELMDTQRQLEANANMIRAQDATLQRLVNDVGKIS